MKKEYFNKIKFNDTLNIDKITNKIICMNYFLFEVECDKHFVKLIS